MQSTALVPLASNSSPWRWLSTILALRQVTEPRNPYEPRIPYTGRTTAGVVVTPDNAVTIPAVWACLRYLSQTVAIPSWHVMRPTPKGAERAPTHPLDYVLCRRANPEWSSFQFRETLTHWALRWGNGYAEIERDSARRPMALWPVHPERVSVKRDPVDGKLFYEINNGSGSPTYLDAADMFHIRGFGEGVVGVNVMAYAAESLGWAKAAQLFGSAFFGKGANPSAVVTMKRPMNQEGLAELTKRFRGLYAGPRAERTVFLDNEMDFKQLTIAPENAQFLETNKFLVTEIARWFGVPPHKIADLERATFSNIEHAAIEAVVDSITPWVVRFETEADYKLMGISNTRNFFTKMNLNALLRGDAASRVAFYTGMRQNGAFTVNDMLRLEDMPTIGPEGDVRVMQSQFVPIEKLGEDKAPAAPAPRQVEEDDDEVEQPEAKRVELELRGPVTRAVCDKLIAQIKAASPQDEIVLRITTKGGDHEASVDLCETLLERKGRTRTIAEGECLSAGVTAFMAGDKEARLCTPGATFLIHKGNWENVPAWRQTFTEGVESAQSDHLSKMFSRRSGTSWFVYRKMMKTDEGETFGAARARALGIVSDVLPARTRRAAKKRKAKK